ncbi:hypothetical protein NSERUTF1_1290 [Nocardia seriolae]|nr:hypothetical protein NSERUTF1_1290 [Nocardia seriolae]
MPHAEWLTGAQSCGRRYHRRARVALFPSCTAQDLHACPELDTRCA